jgi:hypothetical protein
VMTHIAQAASVPSKASALGDSGRITRLTRYAWVPPLFDLR